MDGNATASKPCKPSKSSKAMVLKADDRMDRSATDIACGYALPLT